MEESNSQQQPSLEEIAKHEAKMKVFYEEKLPFLRLWAEHEHLIASIEEAKVRTFGARQQYAKILTSMKEQEFVKEEEGGKK